LNFATFSKNLLATFIIFSCILVNISLVLSIVASRRTFLLVTKRVYFCL
jgi:hypothetical protein